jgi:hypothetical protein
METAIRKDAENASQHLYLSQAYRAMGALDEAKKEAAIFARLNNQRAAKRDRDVERNYMIEFSGEEADQTIVDPTFPLSFPATFSEGETEITAELVIYYCEAEAESLCFIERIRITVPVTISAEGSDTLTVPYAIELPS